MAIKRRAAVGAGGAAIALVALGGLAWGVWIPAAIRDRVAAAAARRGLRATVEDVDVAFSRVVLRGLDAASEPAGLTVRAGEVRLDASLWDIATTGPAAVRALEVRELAVDVDLEAASLDEVMAQLRGDGGSDAEPGSEGRAVRVEGMAVTLVDRRGAVARVSRGRASLEPDGTLQISAGPVELAPGEVDGARAARLHARLERRDEGWKIAYAALGGVEIRYRERDGEARSPLLPRLRRHADRLTPEDGTRPRPSSGDQGQSRAGATGEGPTAQGPTDQRSGDQGTGAHTDDTSGDEGSTGEGQTDEGPRGEGATGEGATGEAPTDLGSRDLGSRDLGSTDEGSTGAGPTDDGPSGASPSEETGASASTEARGPSGAALITRARSLLGPRLAEGAVLELSDLSVRVESGGEPRIVLRDLSAEVRALPEGRFHLGGSGRPGRGGRLGWRLTVDPDMLRAEGRIDFQRLPFALVAPFLPALPWHRPEDARLSGELSIEGRGATRVHLDGEIAVDELALSSPRIAPQPVRRLALGLTGEADWDPIPRRLELARATLTLGGASVHLSGSLEWPEDHYLVDLRATLPPTPCDTAIAAIPADLLAELGGFTFGGQIGGRVQVHVDSRDLDATVLDIDVADGCRFETAPALADVRRFDGPFTHRVLEPDGSVFEMESGPGTASWTPIRDISPFFVHAVLAHEDGAFFSHSGFSVPSIRLALVRNLREHRYVYGASTITMQLVKNVFLHREKTLVRKVQEVVLTWWVESVMSKEDILELYLNVIEYGPGVYGIRAAAEHYFGVPPSELGPAESAYLACILPSPKTFHSHWDEGAVPERFRRRVARFLGTLGSRGRYDAEAVAAGLADLEGLRFHRPGMPRPERPPRRGGTAPLPVGAGMDAAWEEAVGPDDPGFDEENGAEEDDRFDP